MTVETPPFLGLILRKSDRTRGFVEQYLERLREISPGAPGPLNEDDDLIAFSVAMNGHDLQFMIEELEQQHAVYGVDFVATGSGEGVLGEVPRWLSEKSVRLGPYKQLTKVYSFVPTVASQSAET